MTRNGGARQRQLEASTATLTTMALHQAIEPFSRSLQARRPFTRRQGCRYNQAAAEGNTAATWSASRSAAPDILHGDAALAGDRRGLFGDQATDRTAPCRSAIRTAPRSIWMPSSRRRACVWRYYIRWLQQPSGQCCATVGEVGEATCRVGMGSGFSDIKSSVRTS